MYAGEHWSVARGYPALHQPEEDIHLWVCSAGYGLIPVEAPIMPYHATLTPGQADSVPGSPPPGGRPSANGTALPPGVRVASARSWPRTLPQCSCSCCRRTTCVPAGPLSGRLRIHHGPEPAPHRVSRAPAARRSGRVRGPSGRPVAGPFGRTRRALNARIGAHLLSTGIRNKDEAARHLESLLAAQPPIPRYDRKKQSDREILDIIARRLSPGADHISQSNAA